MKVHNFTMMQLYFCFAVALFSVVGADDTACYRALDCVTDEIHEAAIEFDKGILCRDGPQVIKCFEAMNARCKNATFAKKNSQQLQFFVNTLKRDCPTDSNEGATMKDCREEFSTCLSADYLRFSEQNNKEALCRFLPSVTECMSNALKNCPSLQDPAGLKELKDLSDQLESIKKNFSSAECPPDSNEETNSSRGNILAISFIHSWFALTMAALMH